MASSAWHGTRRDSAGRTFLPWALSSCGHPKLVPTISCPWADPKPISWGSVDPIFLNLTCRWQIKLQSHHSSARVLKAGRVLMHERLLRTRPFAYSSRSYLAVVGLAIFPLAFSSCVNQRLLPSSLIVKRTPSFSP
jgi:hypothetical protein